MKNIFIILLVIIGFVLNIPTAYAEEPASGSETEEFKSYEEQFNDNSGKWEIFDTTMAAARIENGKYYIENKSYTGELFILHHADFPLGREFVIEVSIKTMKDTNNHAYGFVMGASDASNSYVFQIRSDGTYAIMKFQEGVPEEISAGMIRKMVFKKGLFNVLKAEKIGDKIRFYINNHYVDEVTEISFFGKRVGFYVEGKSEIAVDYTRSQIWPD